MKVVKILAVIALAYVGVVVIFESLIGYMQPQNESTMVLYTTDEDGEHARVLTHIDYNETSYVAVNHWPRAWYHRANANPDVSAMIGPERADYIAIPVTDEKEFEALQQTRPQSLVFRFLIGFAPREFVRLEPVSAGSPEAEETDTSPRSA